jgi:hypothetical protein
MCPLGSEQLVDREGRIGLRYQGRKRVHHADDETATRAERLVQHLEASGFVLMKRATARGAHDIAAYTAWSGT